MAIPQPKIRMTAAEYYRRERSAELKSDFFNGEIFAMAGGTRRHSRITLNIGAALEKRLGGTPCVPYDSNLRLKIEATGLRTYPDVSVYCGEMKRDAEDETGETFLNPTLVVEVLSPSTEAYDRGLKSQSYRQIPGLLAYMLVAQDRPHAEVYERQPNGRWELREYGRHDETVNLSAMHIQLPLAEIYARVDFASAD